MMLGWAKSMTWKGLHLDTSGDMMPQLIQVCNSQQLQDFQAVRGLAPLDLESFKNHAPDIHFMLESGNALVARCSLWWNDTPTELNQKLGLIGHYAARDGEAAQLLLDSACDELVKHGCGKAIAPINGNTWQSYRFMTERGDEPIFFLEFDHSETYPQHFQENDFLPLASYSSALNVDLLQTDARLEKIQRRMIDSGIVIRPFEMEQFEQELHKIYELSVNSFQHNFLYTPIDEERFSEQYSQVKPYLQPELILMAEDGDQLVGFLFAVPDLLQAKRGKAINTVIIKTVAVLPGRTYAGLGSLLLMRGQAIAHELGYRRAIHALMHDDNKSRNISNRYARTIRRYALFSKQLHSESASKIIV
jgi:L-amino acid N-acyltransferase YncA